MPALPNVPKVLRTAFILSDPGADQDILNRLYLQYSGVAPTATNLQAFAVSVLAAWATRFASLVAAGLTFREVSVEDLTSPTSASAVANGTTVATRAGDPLALGTAMVIKKEISRRYRGGHPRSYFYVGTSPDLATPNSWDTTVMSNVETAYANLLADAQTAIWTSGGTLSEVNVSYFSGFTNHTFPSGRTRPIPSLRATPLIDLVQSIVANPKTASQRRRNQQGV